MRRRRRRKWNKGFFSILSPAGEGNACRGLGGGGETSWVLVERYIAVVGKQEVPFCAGGGGGKRERKVEMEGERRERPCLIEAPVSLFRELSFS